MKTSIKVEAYGSAGYRAVVVQPSGVPPMVGSVADTMAEAVRCMCVVLGHRGDFVPLNTAYPDGSRGHVPSKIDVIWRPTVVLHRQVTQTGGNAMSSESKAVSESDASLANTGKCAMDSIREMVAALECDYDRLEELREERSDWNCHDNLLSWHNANADDADELKTLEESAGDHTDRESAEQAIMEDPLSLEYRSGWTTDKSEMVAEEYCLLLSTGGPATRIVGDLDEHGEATSARLQVQDWGTPWTEHFVDSSDREALLTYARCFCFA